MGFVCVSNRVRRDGCKVLPRKDTIQQPKRVVMPCESRPQFICQWENFQGLQAFKKLSNVLYWKNIEDTDIGWIWYRKRRSIVQNLFEDWDLPRASGKSRLWTLEISERRIHLLTYQVFVEENGLRIGTEDDIPGNLHGSFILSIKANSGKWCMKASRVSMTAWIRSVASRSWISEV